MKPQRYGIYLADLRPSQGSEITKVRPVVVVSDDAMNTNLETIVVCPLTTSLHSTWRCRLIVPCAGKTAEIAVDHIRSISKTRLIKKIDQLTPADAKAVRLLITEMYGE